jgi:hypothetical protein
MYQKKEMKTKERAGEERKKCEEGKVHTGK